MEIYKNNNIDVVYDNQYYIDKNKNEKPIDFQMINSNFIKKLSLGWGPPNLSSLSIRKTKYLKIGGLDEKLRFSEDQDLFIKFDLNNLIVKTINKRLTYFRDISNNRVSYIMLEERIIGTEKFLKKWENLFLKTLGAKNYKKYVNNYYVNMVYPNVMNDLSKLKIYQSAKFFYKYLFTNLEFYRRIIKKIF